MGEETTKNEKNTDYLDERGKFKVGNPGGPGYPPGVKHLSTLLKEELKRNGADKRIIEALIKKAEQGNDRSIQEIFDRLEGKPAQSVDLTAEVVKPLIKL